jgi:hypothetical protein
MLRDVINNDIPGASNVQHFISYVLPSNAQQVRSSDYLVVEMPSYHNITLPQEMYGQFGDPVFSLDGTRVIITGITQLAGTSVQILGMTAQNPGDLNNFTITVKICDDIQCTSVRNQDEVTPATNGTFVWVTATIVNTLPAMSISGWTSPQAFVTLTEADAVVGTTTSDLAGAFNFSLTGLSAGSHTYTLYSTDAKGRSSSPTVTNLFLINGAATSVTNLILSSTMELDKSAINPGDTLTISGSAKPSSQINLFTESPLRSYSTLTDIHGDWSYTLASDESKTYDPGQYRTYSLVQDQYANQSVVSHTLNFTVNAPQDDNPPPACDISRGDLNCDGKVNLTDFSILLFHWQTNHKKADINGDGKVNLVDFSIMMFYFRR